MQALEQGRIAAELLRGTWRIDVPRSSLLPDDELLTPLSQSGSLGLLSLFGTTHASPLASQVRSAQTVQAIQAVLQARVVGKVVSALRSADIDPILFKGLAVTRHYARPGSRSVGDIDLFVAPEDFTRATQVLDDLGYHTVMQIHPEWWAMMEGPDALIDLQSGLPPLPDTEALQALRSSQVTMQVGEVAVRVLPLETEVRMLAVHAVRHGFLRPIWLCDLASAVEGSDHLDWDRVLSGDWLIRSWVSGALGVASRLLDLRLPPFVADRCHDVATWVDPLVLKRWGGGPPSVITEDVLLEAIMRRESIKVVWKSLAKSWPDPLHVVAQRKWPLSHPVARLAVVLAAVERSANVARHLSVRYVKR